MMTAKATVALVLAYVLALAAGTTSGVLAERLRAPAVGGPSAPLAIQLQLTPDQTERMRSAWANVRNIVDDCYEQAQVIDRKRDQVLLDLLTDEQKAKFAAVDKTYAGQFAELSARREGAYWQALRDTEGMLTDAQRVKYEQIIRQRIGRLPMQAGATTQPSLEDRQP
jgi:hypothetical protein